MITISCYLVLITPLFAQITPMRSQHMVDGVLINPAVAGSRDVVTAATSYRNQWAGFGNGVVTASFAAHGPLKKENMALGFAWLHDRIGVSETNGIYGIYSYRLRAATGTWAFGLSGGANFRKNAWTKVQTTDVLDDDLATDGLVLVYPNFSIGTYFYHDRFRGGFSIPLMLSVDDGQDGKSVQAYNDITQYNYMLSFGYDIKMPHETLFKPSLLVRMQPRTGLVADFTASFLLAKLTTIGATLRVDADAGSPENAIVGLVQIQLTDQLLLGYSYDYPTGKNWAGIASAEILLRYDLRYNVRAPAVKYF